MGVQSKKLRRKIAVHWTYTRFETSPPTVFCERCFCSWVIPWPLSQAALSAFISAFRVEHSKCPAPQYHIEELESRPKASATTNYGSP